MIAGPQKGNAMQDAIDKTGRKILVQRFADAVAAYGDSAAIEGPSHCLTFTELNRVSDSVAEMIRRAGVSPGRVVAIYAEMSVDYVAMVLGALKADCVFFPLGAQHPQGRIEAVLAATEPASVLIGKEAGPSFQDKKVRLPSSVRSVFLVDAGAEHASVTPVNFDPYAGDKVKESSITCEDNDACYIITTSGSTGAPKAILGSATGLDHFINWEIAEFGIAPGTRVSALSVPTFDVGLRDVFVPLFAGGTICMLHPEVRRNPQGLYMWIIDRRVAILHIVPTLFRLLTQVVERQRPGAGELDSLKCLLIAGEALYGDDVIRWRRAAGKKTALVNLYGPSETTLAKVFYRIPLSEPDPRHIIALGRPLPKTEIFIIENNVLCQADCVGEILLKTPYRSKGYYRDEAQTRNSFIANPLTGDPADIVYRTGDYGFLSTDGILHFESRRDDQIKFGGNRVELGEVESVLRSFPGVREAAAVVLTYRHDTQRLIGYVAGSFSGSGAIASLRAFVAERLPEYMVPSKVILLDKLPHTHSGKIDRNALPSPERKRPELSQEYIDPSTETEKWLAGLWCELLDLDKAGVFDNFFDLGGSSLLAAGFTVRAAELFNLALPAVWLFEHPTIHAMSKFIDGERTGEKVDPVVPDRSSRRRSTQRKRLKNRKKDVFRNEQLL